MGALAGPYAAAAVLLVVAGLPKTWAPGDTAHALRGLGLPVNRPLVRVLGAAEAATGVAALTVGAAPLVAAWYTVFTGVLVLALRSRRPVASCGCFGHPDTPPTVAHLVLVAAASAVALAVSGREGALLDGQPAYGVPFLLLTGCVAWFAHLLMTRPAVAR